MYKPGKKMVVDKGGIAMAQERSSCDRGGGSASDESSSSQSSMISPDGHPLVVDKGGIAIIFIAVVTFFLAIFIFRISFRILGNLDMVDSSEVDTFPNQVDYLILLVVAVYAIEKEHPLFGEKRKPWASDECSASSMTTSSSATATRCSSPFSSPSP